MILHCRGVSCFVGGANIRWVGAAAVSSVEDPEKMLEQTVNEMQSDLIKMRQASAQVCDCWQTLMILESATAICATYSNWSGMISAKY